MRKFLLAALSLLMMTSLLGCTASVTDNKDAFCGVYLTLSPLEVEENGRAAIAETKVDENYEYDFGPVKGLPLFVAAHDEGNGVGAVVGACSKGFAEVNSAYGSDVEFSATMYLPYEESKDVTVIANHIYSDGNGGFYMTAGGSFGFHMEGASNGQLGLGGFKMTEKSGYSLNGEKIADNVTVDVKLEARIPASQYAIKEFDSADTLLSTSYISPDSISAGYYASENSAYVIAEALSADGSVISRSMPDESGVLKLFFQEGDIVLRHDVTVSRELEIPCDCES